MDGGSPVDISEEDLQLNNALQIAPRISTFMRAHDPCSAGGLSIAQLEQMATMPRRRRNTADLDGLAFSFTAR